MTDELSRVFAALADPTRRDMVARLTDGDATVGDLAAPYDVSLQAVSKHLKVLEEAGLVTRSRDAQRRPVHLEAEVFDLMTQVDRAVPPACRGALPAPRRRAGRLDSDERRRPNRDPEGRNRIMTTEHPLRRTTEAAIEADADRADDPHLARLRRHARRSCSAPTPTPSSSRGGSGPADCSAEIQEWDARDGG